MKGFLLFIIAILLSACPSKPHAVKQTKENSEEESVVIYVVNHGYHTGIVVPAGKIQASIPQLKERFGNTPYIEFGWGDNKFYPANEMTTGLTIRALLWPTKSVIHAVAIPGKVALFFINSHVEKLCLSGIEYSALITFIINSFYTNEKSQIIQLKRGLYGNSQFYQGEGYFSFANTCNTWTAKGLQSAGMDISPAFQFTANSVMNCIQVYNQALKSAVQGETGSAPACR